MKYTILLLHRSIITVAWRFPIRCFDASSVLPFPKVESFGSFALLHLPR